MHNARNLGLAIAPLGGIGAPTPIQVLAEGFTRAQVRAETLRSIRDREIRHGNGGLTEARQFPETDAVRRVGEQRRAMN